MKICYVVAMRAEARPLIEYFNLRQVEDVFSPLPCLLYQRDDLSVVVNGTQGEGIEERDLIGCEAASVATMAAITHLHPDLVISSGTCGGWQRYGGRVGQVYVADGVMFHDRRVPGDNAWDTQGLGNYPVWEGSRDLADKLSLPMGKVTTGSSFDLSSEEERLIDAHGGRLKEMEGAAVAFVCHLYGTPVMLVKAITNLRDAPDDDITAFQQNLRKASEALLEANVRIIKQLTVNG